MLVFLHHMHHSILLGNQVVDHSSGTDNRDSSINLHDFALTLGELDKIVKVRELLFLEVVPFLDPKDNPFSIFLKRFIDFLDLFIKTEQRGV